MGRKKKPSFEDLIKLNRKAIIEDEKLMGKIEEKIEKRMNDTLNR
ncbi:FbpB family small basic protein [Pontibacillus yanchengensis]|uniref:FbpB family small basic protein n=2 Tax=Pontibacillus yanchengensis TaxID=462910 RepID=A0A6I4ZZI3_9BACI|nr:FbpB family small basic protein [Pontibacillus yanchengensis]MYL33272.1 FbpB family small basic protein [Pontibacillus yanchengensis]MYL51892.1 FbpB family small basic protein [Pontibacillus yanchengensis]